MSGEGTTTTAATTTTPVLLSADPGFAGLAPELRGLLENKGWDKKSAFEAAVEAAKSYTEVEKHLGIPRDQIVRMPKDAADAEGWKALNSRLGVPETADKYDFTGVKFADGSDLDDNFSTMLKGTLHAAGVRGAAAPDIAKAVVKFMEDAEGAETTTAAAKLAEQKTELAKSWGANASANKFIAEQAVKKLGLSEEVINTIEQSAGYVATMQALLKIGQSLGEDKFVASQNGNPGVMTREQAEGRLAELKRDSAWVAKVNAGDFKANEEFNALTRLAIGM